MATLAVALGGKAETLSGLSGVGDLMVREVHALEYLYK
jgi:glycerol-3-phosphate dehydrogenase